MKAIAIINLKGGVGKTVTAINMAAILAMDHHKRVLLIDADSQHNTTDFFGAGDADANLSAYLKGVQEPYPENMIQQTEIKGLDILPGDDGLMDLDISLLRADRVHGRALVDLFAVLAEDDAYDYILVDCPPAFSAASAAALAACDEAIIPIKLDAFSVAGLANIIRQIHNMHMVNPRLRVSGCLVTMWTPAAAPRETELRGMNPRMLPIYRQTIRRSDKVDGMTYSGDPLTIYSPRSAAGVDYRRWVREYLTKEVQ